MSATAAAQLHRIVQLVAELSRRESEGGSPLTLGEIAAQFGVSEADVERDLRTLTSAGDAAEQDWLGSLSVLQEGDRVMVSSQGPFRRPVRLSPEEIQAIQVGLSAEEGAEPLTAELAALLQMEEPVPDLISVAEPTGGDERRVVGLARRAAREQRCLEIRYIGSGAERATRRIIEVYELVSGGGNVYLRSWCRTANGERKFRADRVLEARLLDERFTPRDDMIAPIDDDLVFQAPDEAESVSVRFSPAIARWLAEDYPGAVPDERGGLTVRFEVADPAWLVRTVLQYGPEAEVLEPEAYRELVRSASGG